MGNYVCVEGEVGIGLVAFQRLTTLHRRGPDAPELDDDGARIDYYLGRAERWTYDLATGRLSFSLQGKLRWQDVERFLGTLAHLKVDDAVDEVEHVDDYISSTWFLRAGQLAQVHRSWSYPDGDDFELGHAPTVDDVRRWERAPVVLGDARFEGQSTVLGCTTLLGHRFTVDAMAFDELACIDLDRLAECRLIDFGTRVTIPEFDDGPLASIDAVDLFQWRDAPEEDGPAPQESPPPSRDMARAQVSVRGDVEIGYEAFLSLTELHTPRPQDDADDDCYVPRAVRWAFDVPTGRFTFELRGDLLLHHVDRFLGTLAYLKTEDTIDRVVVDHPQAFNTWFLRAGRLASTPRNKAEHAGPYRPATVEQVERWRMAPVVLAKVEVAGGSSLRCTTLHGRRFTVDVLDVEDLREADVGRLRAARLEAFGTHVVAPSRDRGVERAVASAMFAWRVRDHGRYAGDDPETSLPVRAEGTIRLTVDAFAMLDRLCGPQGLPGGTRIRAGARSWWYHSDTGTFRFVMEDAVWDDVLRFMELLASLRTTDLLDRIDVVGDEIRGSWLLAANTRAWVDARPIVGDRGEHVGWAPGLVHDVEDDDESGSDWDYVRPPVASVEPGPAPGWFSCTTIHGDRWPCTVYLPDTLELAEDYVARARVGRLGRELVVPLADGGELAIELDELTDDEPPFE